MTEIKYLSPAALKDRLSGTTELALLDVSEEGIYGLGHIFQAVNTPYSRLELLVPAFVPRKTCLVVLIDQGDGIAAIAAKRLYAIGYTDISVLEGGVRAWSAAGYELFHGVYVPSKAFGEWLEQKYETPSISAQELNALRSKTSEKKDVTILDPRTVMEYAVRHVPGAISCPGAELLYRFKDLVPSSETLVVVACGGRTRGIVGAQTLIDAGVPNKVTALTDGSHGWQLAGLELESGLRGKFGTVSPTGAAFARQLTDSLTQRAALPAIDIATLTVWQNDPSRTTYLLDVRTPEEYAQSHLPGSESAPGGQLVQATDRWMATLRSRVVLVDDAEGGRATPTAYRLRQMGWDAYVLRGGIPSAQNLVKTTVPTIDTNKAEGPLISADVAAHVAPRHVRTAVPYDSGISAEEAQQWLHAGAVAVSLDHSANYLQEHPPGALWANRSRLDTLTEILLTGRALVLFSENGDAAHLAAIDLKEVLQAKGGAGKVAVVSGGLQAWKDAGRPAASAPSDALADNERIDTLYWAQGRRRGDKTAMQLYLDWEKSLLAQVERDGYRFHALLAQ